MIKKIVKVIEVKEAVEIARWLIRDAISGYSYDDLSIEVEAFMEEKAFETRVEKS